MARSWLIGVLALLSVASAWACGGSSGADPPAAVTDTPAASLEASFPPTPLPSPTPNPEDVLRPRPPAGGPCPAPEPLCDAAFDLLARAHAHDSDGMLASTTPRTLTCPAPGQPFPIIVFDRGDVCEGATPGEVRPYFTASGSGEGQAQSQARFAQTLAATVESLPQGPGAHSDAYGSGALAIAAISCFQRAGAPEHCSGEWAEVVLTGVGPSGKRSVACFGLSTAADPGQWLLDSVGCGIPVHNNLYAFSVPAAASEQARGTFTNYPWIPLARTPLPSRAEETLKANLPVQAVLAGECLVGPPPPEAALCYQQVKETATGLEFSLGYVFASGGWKATMTKLADGSYRLDSMVPQLI